MAINKLLYLFALFIFAFGIYSYAFLDPNLTLTSIDAFIDFQKNLQWFGWFNRAESAVLFIFLCLFLYAVYFLILKNKISMRKITIMFFLAGLLLVFAYPAFSHDIFNYIFNAKMVLIYHSDPHVMTALDFPRDPMLGFMRNVHTPAPYWYIWTLISLLPAVFGLGNIFPSMLIFKLFSMISFFGCFWLFSRIWPLLGIKNISYRSAAFLLNPLLLIEAIAVGHNDFAMMFFALLAFYFLLKLKKGARLVFLILVFFLLFMSVGIKYATVVLIPLFLLYYFFEFDIGFIGAALLFSLPFSRIEQLHSWYLIWPLTWIFLSKSLRLVNFFLVISVFALLRYAPYIYHGNWDPPVFGERLFIYIAGPCLWFFFSLFKKLKNFGK